MTPPCRRVCRRKYNLQAPYISLVAQQRVSHRFPFIVPCKKPPFIIRASQILSAGVVIDDGGFHVSAGRIEARSSLTGGFGRETTISGFAYFAAISRQDFDGAVRRGCAGCTKSRYF